MINYKEFNKIGKYLIMAGGTLLTAGLGMTFITNRIEKSELKRQNEIETNKIKQSRLAAQLDAENEAKLAKAAKDKEYTSRLATMDKKEFAKFHAEEVARANSDVIANAERACKDMEAKVVRVKLDAKDEIDAIREECLKKLEDANRKRDEAVKKYEDIDLLFTNKDKILAAKKALDESVAIEKKEKAEKEALMKEIKKMMED